MVASSIAKAIDLGGHARQHLVHRRAGRRAAAGDLRAGHRPRARAAVLPVSADERNDPGRARRRDRHGRAEPPGEAQRADPRDVARAGRGDRRAVGRRRACAASSLRGAGEKAFSPGNDIGEFATRARRTRRRRSSTARTCTRRPRALAACRHPMVAQIHGICVGGGLEIAALCDLRICGESSRFGAPIKNLGLVMAYAEMAPLVRLCGPRRRARDPARGPHLRRRRGEGEAASSRASCPTPRSRPRRARRRSASPTARRWSRAGTRSSRVASPIRRRSRAAEHDECFDCFDTEDFRDRLRGVPRQAQAASSRGDERESAARAPHPGPLAGMRVLELAQIMAGPDLRHDARRHGRRRRSRSRSCPAATTRAATASRASTACRRRS